jgi:hypothetical protein
MTKAQADALMVILKAMNVTPYELMAYTEATWLDQEQAELEAEGISMSVPAIIEQHKFYEVSEASYLAADYWDKVTQMYVLIYKRGF